MVYLKIKIKEQTIEPKNAEKNNSVLINCLPFCGRAVLV